VGALQPYGTQSFHIHFHVLVYWPNDGPYSGPKMFATYYTFVKQHVVWDCEYWYILVIRYTNGDVAHKDCIIYVCMVQGVFQEQITDVKW